MTHRVLSSIAFWGSICLAAGCGNLPAEPPATPVLVTDVVFLTEKAVTESSGLAASRRTTDRFWTHNDSGGQAKLFAFDSTGRSTGRMQIQSAKAVDWEDMASYVDSGVPRLLVADCGDNGRKRSSMTLYLMDEPDPNSTHTVSPQDLTVLSVIYPDGPRDCEAVAVDPKRKKILLVTKSFLPVVGVYTVPLPSRVDGTLTMRHKVTAKRIATLTIPLVTAMDINQQNGDVWVAGYFQAFCFTCEHRTMSFTDQFAALPQPIELPRWRQIEAIAIDPSQRPWVTSEGVPTPFGRIPNQPDN